MDSEVAIPPIMLIDSESVSALLRLEECVLAVEAAFRAHAEGRSLEPQLASVHMSEGEFHIKMGGICGERTYFVCKIGGGFFNNRVRFGLPSIIGVIVLCDGATGRPLAVMDSGVITRLRTGAATAVAAKYLARPDSRTVTVCGAGNQARIQIRSLLQVLPIERVYIWSHRGAGDLGRWVSQELGLEVVDNAELVASARQSDVIVTCTPSRQWIIGREHVRPGTFIAAVGADSPQKQEIEPQLLASCPIVTDLTDQCLRVGDSHHALDAGLITVKDIRGQLGDVIAGKTLGRASADESIIFDSTGTALQDAAAASLVYEAAVAAKSGTKVCLWA